MTLYVTYPGAGDFTLNISVLDEGSGVQFIGLRVDGAANREAVWYPDSGPGVQVDVAYTATPGEDVWVAGNHNILVEAVDKEGNAREYTDVVVIG